MTRSWKLRTVSTSAQVDLDQTPQTADHVGWSLALNRTDSGGCYGVIIGSPREDVSGQANAGMAHILTLASPGTGCVSGGGSAEAGG